MKRRIALALVLTAFVTAATVQQLGTLAAQARTVVIPNAFIADRVMEIQSPADKSLI